VPLVQFICFLSASLCLSLPLCLPLGLILTHRTVHGPQCQGSLIAFLFTRGITFSHPFQPPFKPSKSLKHTPDRCRQRARCLYDTYMTSYDIICQGGHGLTVTGNAHLNTALGFNLAHTLQSTPRHHPLQEVTLSNTLSSLSSLPLCSHTAYQLKAYSRIRCEQQLPSLLHIQVHPSITNQYHHQQHTTTDIQQQTYINQHP